MTPMQSAETMRRAEDIFHQVLGHLPHERSHLLQQLCGDDRALRDEVDSLLCADADPATLAPSPLVNGEARVEVVTIASTLPLGEKTGDVIGRYKLLQKIGEGAFGVVFTAEQREPVRRMVALKIIKAGMDTREVLTRFEAERQALAMMDHPNVAKVFDAGATAAGRPYFVMEHVAGMAIDEYCDGARLTIRHRLALFIDICNAVQHAHQKGIVHRDLKPSNILVTLQDGKPVPKVIDFGVAKATIGRLTERTLFTETGRLIGTPEYMAPEQAGTSGLDIDTRADIYSLGAILYVLLTGTLPFDPKTLRSAGFEGMAKIIRELEPPRPSTRLSTLETEKINRKPGETPQEIGKRYGVDFRLLQRELRGDLDWITLKALEKDRARRYETASGLAADVRRFLSGEPVLAAPPSATYRVRKFVRKHRAGVAAGFAIATVLVMGIVGTTTGLLRALQAEDEQRRLRSQADVASLAAKEAEARAVDEADAASEARRQAEDREADARAVREFLENMFANVDPTLRGMRAEVNSTAVGDAGEAARTVEGLTAMAQTGSDVTVLDLLERAIPEIERAAAGRPLVEAALRQLIGRTLLNLGERSGAETQLERAEELYRTALGERHPDRLAAVAFCAESLAGKGNQSYDQRLTERLLKDVEIMEEVLGPDDPITLRAKYFCALDLEAEGGQEDAVQIMMEDVAQRCERSFGAADPFTLQVQTRLAMRQSCLGQFAEAETQVRRIIDLATDRFGADDPAVIAAQRELAAMLARAERTDEAIVVLQDAFESAQRVFGCAHPTTNLIYGNLGWLLRLAGRLDEAQRFDLDFNQRCKSAYAGPFHACRSDLAYAVQRARAGQAPDGKRILELVRASAAIDDPEHTRHQGWCNTFSTALRYLSESELAELIGLLEQDWQRLQAGSAGEDHRFIIVPATLAFAYSAAERHADALPLLRRVYETWVKQFGRDAWKSHDMLRWVCGEIAALGSREEDLDTVARELELYEKVHAGKPRAFVHAIEAVVGQFTWRPDPPLRVVDWARRLAESARSAECTFLWRYHMQQNYAEVLFQAGHLDEAIKNGAEALAGFQKHNHLCRTAGVVGRIRLSLDEARVAVMLAARDPSPAAIANLAECAERAWAGYEKWLRADFNDFGRLDMRQAIEHLIRHLEAGSRVEEADTWRPRLAQLNTVRGTP